ncbi:hypothetical protein [Streptomyces hirsutus]|uniref:hypothetical protein n=1 Tax=Streptomyces hirsutus TaxID=35620 RepID=UPI00197DF606|nr:hypothetical protein [Streptomyces hirsutus]
MSGVLLLFTFLVPPAWALDAYGAVPDHDLSADVPPFVVLLAIVFNGLSFHVVVQIPSGLLGTWLGRNRTAGVCYVSVLAVAGVLTIVLLWGVLGADSVAQALPLWADFMARGSLALAAHVWLSRRLRAWPVRPCPRVSTADVRLDGRHPIPAGLDGHERGQHPAQSVTRNGRRQSRRMIR